jgi:hypothetical protein
MKLLGAGRIIATNQDSATDGTRMKHGSDGRVGFFVIRV